MASIDDILASLRASPANANFNEVKRLATHYFGEPRVSSSHHIWKTPWPGDPRVNLQEQAGQAKPYQVKQLLAAIEALEAQRATQAAEATNEKKVETKAKAKTTKRRP